MPFLSPACFRVLRTLRAAEGTDQPYDAEIVGEGGIYYLGLNRISPLTVKKLLQVTALRHHDLHGGTHVYTLNETGYAILRRPALADEVYVALLTDNPFTVVNDHVAALERILVSPTASESPNAPHRVQLRRVRGYRLPPNTIVVTRASKHYGNPFVIGKDSPYGFVPDADTAVRFYRRWLTRSDAGRQVLQIARQCLPRHNLACFCGLHSPCHADVLLELVNDTPAHPSAR